MTQITKAYLLYELERLEEREKGTPLRDEKVSIGGSIITVRKMIARLAE